MVTVTADIPYLGREHLHLLNLSSLPYNPNFLRTSQRMEAQPGWHEYLKVPLRVLYPQDWIKTLGTLLSFPNAASRTAARDSICEIGD